MTDIFDPSKSFRTVKFNMNEFAPGFTAAHVWNAPLPCVLLSVPNDQLLAADMWQQIYSEARAVWDNLPPVNEKLCPNCESFLRLSQRLWRGKAFCQVCGMQLTADQSMGEFWWRR
jgi:uncharacterized paraquat-inducible protein A